MCVERYIWDLCIYSSYRRDVGERGMIWELKQREEADYFLLFFISILIIILIFFLLFCYSSRPRSMNLILSWGGVLFLHWGGIGRVNWVKNFFEKCVLTTTCHFIHQTTTTTPSKGHRAFLGAIIAYYSWADDNYYSLMVVVRIVKWHFSTPVSPSTPRVVSHTPHPHRAPRGRTKWWQGGIV